MDGLVRWMMVLAVCAALQMPAMAVDSDSGGSSGSVVQQRADPVLEQARQAAAARDWTRAASQLKDALAKDSQNADYHNLYAYSLRNGPNPDMGLVFKHYGEALRIDPKHRGAHEYIGEAYLQTGNLGKAKEHLSALDRLCFFPCEEYTDLKKKVAEYESKTGALAK